MVALALKPVFQAKTAPDNYRARSVVSPSALADFRRHLRNRDDARPVVVGDALGDMHRSQLVKRYNEQIAEIDDFTALISHCFDLYEGGHNEEAIIAFSAAIERRTDFPQIYACRGEAFLRINKPLEAIPDFSLAIKLRPDYFDYYESRGDAFLQAEKFEKAIEDFNKCLKLRPRHADSYQSRGEAYLKSGDREKAITDLNEAIKLRPRRGDSYSSRGEIYLNDGKFEEAIADFNSAIKYRSRDTDYPALLCYRGEAFLQAGKFEEAITDFRESSILDPKAASPHVLLGYTFLATDRPHEGFAAFAQAIMLDPGTVEWSGVRAGVDEALLRIGQSGVTDNNIDNVTVLADNPGTMDFSSAFIQAASEVGLTPDRLWKAAEAEKLRETAAAKAETTHPAAPPPPRPQWPRDATPEESDNPAAFAWRAYAAEAKAGTLHRGIIAQDDKKNGTTLRDDLVSWLRSAKNQARVPEGFDIPTKPEWNTRQLAKVDPATLRREPVKPQTIEAKLYDVAQKRRSRARHRVEQISV